MSHLTHLVFRATQSNRIRAETILNEARRGTQLLVAPLNTCKDCSRNDRAATHPAEELSRKCGVRCQGKSSTDVARKQVAEARVAVVVQVDLGETSAFYETSM